MTVSKEETPTQGILTKTTPADQGLVKFPTLSPHLEFHNIGDDQSILVSESFNTLLEGKLYSDVLSLLDRSCTLETIVAELKDEHDLASVLTTIATLSSKGYVVSAEHSMDRAQAAYWSTLGASPRWVEHRLAEARVQIEGDNAELARLLREAGVVVSKVDPQLNVLICEDYLAQEFTARNRRQLALKAPWMLARPRGIEPLFGPIFHADAIGPCWSCLAHRLRSHQEVHAFLRAVSGENEAFKPFATNSVALDGIYRLIANEIVNWLVLGVSASLHQHAIVVNIATFETSKHYTMRRPQCSDCGDQNLIRSDRSPVPLCLSASPKTERNSGGTRSVPASGHIAKISPPHKSG